MVFKTRLREHLNKISRFNENFVKKLQDIEREDKKYLSQDMGCQSYSQIYLARLLGLAGAIPKKQEKIKILMEHRQSTSLYRKTLKDILNKQPDGLAIYFLMKKFLYFNKKISYSDSTGNDIQFLKDLLRNLSHRVSFDYLLNYGITNEKIRGEYSFRVLSKIRKDDIRNIVTGIIRNESNVVLETSKYEFIARAYYALQFQIKTFNALELKEVLSDVLNRFDFYKGRIYELNEILKEEDSSCKMFIKKARFKTLESALEAFEESKKAGDNSPDNKSYRGMCITNMVQLNRHLKMISREKMTYKLTETNKCLKEVLEERLRIGNASYKDYSRLAECKFRLANHVHIIKEKRILYNEAIENSKSAIDKLSPTREDIKAEVFGLIGESFRKLALISDDTKEREYNLNKSLEYCKETMEIGDKSPEIKSKCAQSNLILAEIELSKESFDKDKICSLVEESKKYLEDICKFSSSIFPCFLFGDLGNFTSRARRKGFKKLPRINKQDWWRRGIRRYLNNTDIDEEEHVITEPEGEYDLLRNVFLLKGGEKEDLETEERFTLQIGMKFNERNEEAEVKYFVPTSLGIHNKNGLMYYAMRRSKGNTLLSFIEREEDVKNHLKNIVDCLALVHTELPSDGEHKTARESANRALDELVKYDILNEKEVVEILEKYGPIEDAAAESIFVFNKDAHPNNWIIDRMNNIVAIDFDRRGSIPQSYDLAKLFEHIRSLSLELKEELLSDYMRSYNSYSSDKKIENFDDFKAQYFNSVIHKAFRFAGGLFFNIKERRPYTLSSIQNALDSIEIVQRMDSYKKYEEEYNSLYEHLNKIREKIIL